MDTMPRLRRAIRNASPGLTLERACWEAGQIVVGLDEVGRGAWAGPLTVGAVVVPTDRRIYKVRDSKMLSEDEREAMYGRIVDWAAHWAVGHASERECDDLGMSDAQRLAARRALEALGTRVDRVLLDGKWDFVGDGRSRTIVRGDRSSLSIAAASIVAKVTRDRIMRRQASSYDRWSFDTNKGYPCPSHKAALQAWGPSAIHRRSWVFMESLPWNGVERVVRDGDQLRLAI